MITLYINPHCPFCIKDIEEAKKLGIELNLKDVRDPEVEKELIEKGGKKQMPFMVDDETGVSMYESADIQKYLDEKHG